jgi:hypothetical protein
VGGNTLPLEVPKVAAGQVRVGRPFANSNERMSVNSVLPGLSPSYGPLSGSGSQNAKSTARAKEFPDQTAVNADPSQVTGAEADSATQDASAPTDRSTGTAQFQSTLEQALRQGGATSESATSAASDSLSEQSSPGIAIYQRISQYGNSEPSTSALLKRWNSIMQSGGNVDGAAADFAKALAQNETPGLDSGVIDLTA